MMLTARMLVLMAMALAMTPPAVAAQCSFGRTEQLQTARASFFNSYYFSTSNDPDRCGDLQSAIFYQQELVAWLEVCDRDGVPAARLELARLAGLADPTQCLP